MKCRPHLKQNGKVITNTRNEGAYNCDETCPYYQECLKESKGGNERIAKLGLYSDYTQERASKYQRKG